MRRLAERLLRNASLRRRLPSGAVIWVSPDSQLKYLRREFDRDLVRLAKDHTGPGSVVWDIGANCGVFAFSATQAKSVVAVEADPFLCHLLQRSVLANDPSNVTVLPGAISEAVGIAEFAIASRGRASNFLVQHGGRRQSGGRRIPSSVRHTPHLLHRNRAGQRRRVPASFRSGEIHPHR